MSLIISMLVVIGQRADKGLYEVSNATSCKLYHSIQKQGGLKAVYAGLTEVKFNDQSQDERYDALEQAECL